MTNNCFNLKTENIFYIGRENSSHTDTKSNSCSTTVTFPHFNNVHMCQLWYFLTLKHFVENIEESN